MATHWNQYVIRVADQEWTTWKEFCKKNHIKRADLIRNAVRFYIANPDFVNGVVKAANNGVDIRPVVDGITRLMQKVEVLENKLTSISQEKNLVSITKSKILDAVLRIKKRARNSITTVDRLREQIIKIDRSLAPFLVASVTCPVSPFDEVLSELEGKELRREYGGIINFKVINDAQRKKD